MGLLEVFNALLTAESMTITPNFKTNRTETLKSTRDIKLIPTEIRKKIFELSRCKDYLEHIIKRNTNNYL
jgi:hypothetical protein